ncbi:guanine nucleotide-binding protein G(T) subunit gamma-T1 [Aquarana catesbeiana]|uniref:Guanine nucleotide-binding protein subunit gamma n=1 Tax=Aquarana catesbeiana TaxID=8400 RepID=C1C3S0_AQUCT|nr:Guanine nucleotide-binding protein GT subunit gamma-T1 precursor [Aquarana catesbeiana]
MPVINIEDLTEKDKAKMEVEQLKKEVKLERQLVSKACEEIKTYIEGNSGEDPLVKGIPEDKNPFKEKGGCLIA